jgi:2-amino-4-hydroxy-6-hydroxymethyldihydropteridine diphosphokinase
MPLLKNRVFIGTGSNIGNRRQMLQDALWHADHLLGGVRKYSAVYETAAWGITDQAAFLNQVFEIETIFTPRMLMRKILDIEQQMGRKRGEKWGPRIIDIDILFFGNTVIKNNITTIPHPQLQARSFVLQPLAEIAPNFVHPVFKKSVQQLLLICEDKGEIKKLI